MAKKAGWALLLGLVGCSHVSISRSDLDRTTRPAFVSRIEEEAGPKSRVFQEDAFYRTRLKRLDPKEADRRLQLKLAQTSRFQVSERLRSVTLANLPKEKPWTEVVSGADTARVLESFLVQEVPANRPDYDLLRPLSADTVVEFVVQQYGMRSAHGKAGVFVRGYGHMFFLDGGEVWRMSFDEDEVRDGVAALDPFEVGKNPTLFGNTLSRVLDRVAMELADDLNPKDRRSHLEPVKAPASSGSDELSAPPDDTNTTGKQKPDETPGTAPGMQAPTEIPVDPKMEKKISPN